MFRAMQCCLQYALCYSTHIAFDFRHDECCSVANGISVPRRQLLKACGLWTLGCGGLYVPAIQRNNVTVR